jgi:hypothetical protein
MSQKVVASKTFKFNYNNPEDTVAVLKTNKVSPTQGIYSLNSVAQFSGPIFKIASSEDAKSSESKRLLQKSTDLRGDAHLVTVSSPLSETFEYVNPSGAMNLYEPQLMYSASNTINAPYQVGVRVTPVSTLLYYYGDVGNFWYVEDIGYKCSSFDVDFAENKQTADNAALLWAGVCEEGGETWFRYFVKGYKSGSSKAGVSGLKAGEWNVSVSKMGHINDMPVFIATAHTRINNSVRWWTISLKYDENQNFIFD